MRVGLSFFWCVCLLKSRLALNLYQLCRGWFFVSSSTCFSRYFGPLPFVTNIWWVGVGFVVGLIYGLFFVSYCLGLGDDGGG